MSDPTVRFLILQPTPFCNISCKYCYLPDRSSKAVMSLETIKRIFSSLYSSGWVGPELMVAWHVGEPLVLPIEYYRAAFDTIERLTPAAVKIQYAFQTNGMLIDDDWCRFFKAHNVQVGVSLDGPEDVHNANRLTRSGSPTFAQTIAGIRCLQRNDVGFGIITVLSSAALGKAKELYEFYSREGIKGICFNAEEIEGSNQTTSLADRENEYDVFLRTFWNMNTEANDVFYIREFAEILEKIMTPRQSGNSLVEPFVHLNVDWQGNYSTFSPELLGHKNEYYGDFIIGNFHKNSLAESLESASFRRMSSDVAEGVRLCRSSCEYFPICGGGSPANKLFENKTMASTETMFCRLNVKLPADIAMEIIENSAIEGNGMAARPAKIPSRNAGPASAAIPENPLWQLDTRTATRRVTIYSDDLDWADRVKAAAGGIWPSCDPDGASSAYEDGSIIPANDWRDLDRSGAQIVISDTCPSETGTGIALTCLPAELLEPFRHLRAAAASARDEGEIEPLIGSTGVNDGIKAAAGYFLRHYHHPAAEADGASVTTGIAVKRPGLPTVSIDQNTNRFIGLHLDDWHSFPLEQRHASPNRICVNLGLEDRFLLFINRPLAQMYQDITSAGCKIRMTAGGTPIARAFMRLFPGYPVLRVRIRPGEAYIAPTENIAHDASSVGMSTMDVTLQVRGSFALSPRRASVRRQGSHQPA
jgi:uncharacterized protein